MRRTNDSETRATVGMVLILALLATAGSAAPTPHPGPKPEGLAQRLCDALHALPAKRKSECCGTTASSLAGLCARELAASIRSAAATLDAAQVERCTAATSRQLEGCGWVTPVLPNLPEACRNIIQGRLKAGVRCGSSVECQDGLFCRGVGPESQGICTAPAAAHTRCEVPADNLAAFTRGEEDPRHAVCDGFCIKGQCLPFSPAGGSCESSSQCRPGLNCIARHCQGEPLPKIGEPCPDHTACQAGAYCQAGHCAALKNAGEPCALPFECRAFECVKSPGAQTGSCGEPCGPLTSSPTKP